MKVCYIPHALVTSCSDYIIISKLFELKDIDILCTCKPNEALSAFNMIDFNMKCVKQFL